MGWGALLTALGCVHVAVILHGSVSGAAEPCCTSNALVRLAMQGKDYQSALPVLSQRGPTRSSGLGRAETAKPTQPEGLRQCYIDARGRLVVLDASTATESTSAGATRDAAAAGS